MERYIKFAGLDFDLEKRLIEYISNHEKKMNSLAEKCKKHGFSCLARRSDMMRFALHTSNTPKRTTNSLE